MNNLNINSSSSQKFERSLSFTAQMHLENIRMCLNIEVVGSVHPLMHLFGSTPVSTLFYMKEIFSCIWPASYIVSWQDKIKYLVSYLVFCTSLSHPGNWWRRDVWYICKRRIWHSEQRWGKLVPVFHHFPQIMHVQLYIHLTSKSQWLPETFSLLLPLGGGDVRTDEQTFGRMDGISPLCSTFSFSITAYGRVPLNSWCLWATCFWAADPKGTKSCRTQGESVGPYFHPPVCLSIPPWTSEASWALSEAGSNPSELGPRPHRAWTQVSQSLAQASQSLAQA